MDCRDIFWQISFPYSNQKGVAALGRLYPSNLRHLSDFNEGVYRKVTSSNKSPLEAHTGLFKCIMKGIFDPYVL